MVWATSGVGAPGYCRSCSPVRCSMVVATVGNPACRGSIAQPEARPPLRKTVTIGRFFTTMYSCLLALCMFHCDRVTDSNGTTDTPKTNEKNEQKLTARDAQEPERLLRQDKREVRDSQRLYGKTASEAGVLAREASARWGQWQVAYAGRSQSRVKR